MIAIIGIILLIGIVKKDGIMLVDFALEVERSRGTELRGIDLPGLRAPLPAHPHDDDGGAARWRAADAGHRRRLGDTPTARLYIVGGLILSQLLTLFTTPVVYLYLDRLQQLFRRDEPRAGSCIKLHRGLKSPATLRARCIWTRRTADPLGPCRTRPGPA